MQEESIVTKIQVEQDKEVMLPRKALEDHSSRAFLFSPA